MSTLKVYTIESAPEGSKSQLEQSVKSFGMLPGLHGVLAGSPEALKAYKTLHELFSNSSFNAEELTVVWQTINVEHECHYCVPAHTAIANMMKVDPVLSEALRNGEAMPNEKLQALKDTTLSIVRNRGRISDTELEAFYAAGYGERQVLDIILGIAQKTMSNYTNHIANTPVDEPFQKFTWSK
ncbi:carboxymuconolactone decarboxylase family protein [Aquimarina sp. BL5]|uniref:carboxymuconolactone decarboxylase family protein n=1 Tax=Aquimarina sp. BL5 TaxID=1714860 RepID=UPI000E54365D|nr:carboxymuconolactone decarboxylase family protein [Aquimarina sp. BL5]AXT50887.1 carboxymuconolactone decarboxylase family protein [Aquimarina sp. BL5]RKN02530.1 carboxymuconolactone decarboxylase family protein [Aquimarina sp. BL5]